MRYGMPGVSIERADASRTAPIVLRTDITAFVGLAERGPLDTPVPIESWRQFQAHFGQPNGGAYLAYAVRGFFDNGGRRCWTVRVAARQFDGSEPIGEGSGGAQRAMLLLRDIGGSTVWRLAATSPGSWGNGLTVTIERERPLTQTARGCNATSATLASSAGFATFELIRLTQPGKLPVYRVLVDIDAKNGTLDWVHPDPAQRTSDERPAPLDPALPLAIERFAYRLTVWQNGEFAAQYRDLHPSLRHPRHIGTVLANPYPTPVALQRTPPSTDTGLPQPPAPIQVDIVSSTECLPIDCSPDSVLVLAGGTDGMAALVADDFIGIDVSPQDDDFVRARGARGLKALAAIDEISLVAIPDILIQPQADPSYAPLRPAPANPCVPCPPPAPPRQAHQPRLAVELPPFFSEADVLRVQTALIADCEARGDRFALLALPFARAADLAQGPRAAIEWRRLLTENRPARQAALYAPWLAVPIADSTGAAPPVSGSVANVRLVPPCGHLAGAIARTDLTLGVMRAPANLPIAGIVDVRGALSDAQHGELNDAGVDVLRATFGQAPVLLGARTVSDDPDWRYVNTVRMVLALERAFDIALRWTVFEPNDDATRAAVATTLSAILRLFWERGAFAGATMAESFFVRCDAVSTDRAARDAGELIALVGIAPAAPAEFIVLRVGRQDNLPVFSLAQAADALGDLR